MNNKLIGTIIIVAIALIGAYYIGQNSKGPVQEPLPIKTEANYIVPTPVAKKNPANQSAKTSIELSENPEYLFSKNFDPSLVKVYGVGVGDYQSKIDPSSVVEGVEYFGWIHTTNKIGYRIADNKVVEISLNSSVLARMGIFRQDEIIIRFGKPDQTNESGNSPYKTFKYYYINKGLVVSYYETGGLAVNIIDN